MIDWEAIRQGTEIIREGGAKQIKGENWTVYLTESCIRIDIHRSNHKEN